MLAEPPKKVKFLVIDDSSVMRSMIELSLKNPLYEFYFSDGGEDALSQLKLHLPDVILCDYNIPKMNGITLLKEMKKLHSGHYIMLTTEEKVKMESLAAGATGFFTKPFQPSTLKNFIKILLE
jgi:two-component system chemotaxis response regulator CheY